MRTLAADIPRSSRLLVQACGLCSIAAGVSSLIGWVLEIPRLTDWTNGGISMLANTALCSALGGVVLLLFAGTRERRWLIGARVIAGAVSTVGGLTLLQHLTGWNLGIDTLLVDRPWGQHAAAAPMRMGPPASASFLLLGIAMNLAAADGASRRLASGLALGTLSIAFLSITGYWFGANQLFGLARFTGIAFQTSTVIAALSIGIIACLPAYGVAAVLHRNDAGGALLRRLLWPIVLVPMVLGWLRILGEQAGYYDLAFGAALRTIFEIALLLLLLWWASLSVSRQSLAAETANARLAAIVGSSDDAILSKSLTGVIQSWNGGAERVFGYTSADAIGKHVSIIVPIERLAEEAAILERLQRGERVEHFETIRLRSDGAHVPVSLTASPVRDENGNIVGASSIARSLMDRKRIEDQLRAVVEATPECVMIIGPDGTLEFINGAGMAMIEDSSEHFARGASVYDFIAPEHRGDWIDRHRRICAGERMSWQFEIVGLQGTRRWMETHAVPLALADGRIGQLAVTRDITSRRTLEQEREDLLKSERAARSEAERASHLKDEFLATLSHELRTPLNAILGWAQILNAASTPADLSEGLAAIERNARAQAQLIEDLLDMSRIISGKVRLEVQLTDLVSVIDGALASVAPAADAKAIRVRKVLTADANPVMGDPVRLQQVVWNLLSNAVKFTPSNGAVDVVLDRSDSHVEITVRDNGAGIAAEHLPIIFDRFRQVDSSTTRRHGGLGLGLSIVKQLVELHGGTVAVHSPGEGRGATFVVKLPLAPRRDEPSGIAVSDSRPAILDHAQVDLAGVKVLVVDDEADARTLVARVLTQWGADVAGADSAAAGLQQLRTLRPHVLISDIGMPGADGYQFIREVRSLDPAEGGATPAIALTAFARSEDRMRSLLAGFQMHLSKPIEPQELVIAVDAFCRRGENA